MDSSDDYIDSALREYNMRSRVCAGVLGFVLLLTVLVVSFVFRAKPPPSSPLTTIAVATANPTVEQCVCLATFSARRWGLIASVALGVLILVLTAASDGVACDTVARQALLATAFALHVIVGIVMYSLSSCGCAARLNL
jgi:hypothetical protein